MGKTFQLLNANLTAGVQIQRLYQLKQKQHKIRARKQKLGQIMQQISPHQLHRQDRKTQGTQRHFLAARTKQILKCHILVDQDMALVDHQVHLHHPDFHRELRGITIILLQDQLQTIYGQLPIQVRKNNFFVVFCLSYLVLTYKTNIT